MHIRIFFLLISTNIYIVGCISTNYAYICYICLTTSITNYNNCVTVSLTLCVYDYGAVVIRNLLLDSAQLKLSALPRWLCVSHWLYILAALGQPALSPGGALWEQTSPETRRLLSPSPGDFCTAGTQPGPPGCLSSPRGPWLAAAEPG